MKYQVIFCSGSYSHIDYETENEEQAYEVKSELEAGEKVQVVDNTNGARIETYVIPGQRGSGCIYINGAAAHLVHVGDTVIIMAYALMTPEEVKEFKPSIVFPNNNHLA